MVGEVGGTGMPPPGWSQPSTSQEQLLKVVEYLKEGLSSSDSQLAFTEISQSMQLLTQEVPHLAAGAFKNDLNDLMIGLNRSSSTKECVSMVDDFLAKYKPTS